MLFYGVLVCIAVCIGLVCSLLKPKMMGTPLPNKWVVAFFGFLSHQRTDIVNSATAQVVDDTKRPNLVYSTWPSLPQSPRRA